MIIRPFLMEDIDQLAALQPPTWSDIVPRFSGFLADKNCEPITAFADGMVIGVGTTIKHRDTAWLACIIVHPQYQNRGIGRKITEELIQSLPETEFTTIYLDATDMGFPVYQKLGFQLENYYGHFIRTSDPFGVNISKNIIPYEEKYRNDVLNLDHKISGEFREHLLLQHLQDTSLYMESQVVQGFYMPHFTEGLIIADNQTAGLSLMQKRITEKTNAALPDTNTQAIQLLEHCGFERIRKSRRMYLRKKRDWHPEGIYNRISGQLG